MGNTTGQIPITVVGVYLNVYYEVTRYRTIKSYTTCKRVKRKVFDRFSCSVWRIKNQWRTSCSHWSNN